jgi:hypothetical protein
MPDVYDATEEFDVMAGEDEDYAPDIEDTDDQDDEALHSSDDVSVDDEEDPDDDEGEDEEEHDLAGEDEEEDEESDEDDGEDGPDPIDPPPNWPQQEQAFFRELPPALQHAYLDRAKHMMADYTRKTQEIARVRQGYQEMERVISPHVQKWALNGMGPAQAMQQLIALSDYATQSPQEFIKYFANLRGVDLRSLGQPQEEEYVDPQVHALRQQLAGVQQQLNYTAQAQVQAQQAAQQQQYQAAYDTTNAAIEDFASQVGPDGKPLYPYFNQLEEDMAVEIESGRAASIHEAYERAKWSNPYTRSKLLAQSRMRDNRAQRRRAEEAMAAASSLTGASSMYGEQSTEGMSTRQLLEAASAGLI